MTPKFDRATTPSKGCYQSCTNNHNHTSNHATTTTTTTKAWRRRATLYQNKNHDTANHHHRHHYHKNTNYQTPQKQWSYQRLMEEPPTSSSSWTTTTTTTTTTSSRQWLLDPSYTSTSTSSTNLQDRTTTPMALKRLHAKTLQLAPPAVEEALRDLHKEVRILAHLARQQEQEEQEEEQEQHPNHGPPHIVTLLGISSTFWTDPETAFLVQEQLSESLDQTIARWKRRRQRSGGGCCHATTRILPGVRPHSSNRRHSRRHRPPKRLQDRLLEIALGMARAMEFLHAHGILFRDLKPANVGFGWDGQVRLLDFGLARMVPRRIPHPQDKKQHHQDKEEDDSDSETRSEPWSLEVEEDGRHWTRFVGTLRYMAPEMARRETYSFSTDVYSFGQVLWELYTWQKPHAHITRSYELLRRIQQSGYPPPSPKRNNRTGVSYHRQPCSSSTCCPLVWGNPGEWKLARSISSPTIRHVVRESCQAVPAARPSFVTIAQHLLLDQSAAVETWSSTK